MEKDILKSKWKTIECFSGEKCWCLPIVIEDYEKDVDEYIVPCGSISKQLAEYLVKLHNDSLNINK